jgi:hypothetical protein
MQFGIVLYEILDAYVGRCRLSGMQLEIISGSMDWPLDRWRSVSGRLVAICYRFTIKFGCEDLRCMRNIYEP